MRQQRLDHPLSEARGERYYEDALLIIKEELFKQYTV